MKQGLYALISLDEGPLDDVALDRMGLVDDPVRFPGGVLRMIDAQAEAAASVVQTGSTVFAFLGYLDEPEQLGGALELMAGNSPAVLAKAAFYRFGSEMPMQVLGEWVLLAWDVVQRTLTVVTSMSCRDTVCFSTDGRQVAIGPGMVQLSRLPWNSGGIDPQALALTMSRAGLRHALGDRTVWNGVARIPTGTTERFTLAGRTTAKADPDLPQQVWQGSFEEAIEQIDALGRRMVRQHLERYRGAAFLLSGGLDSSLLTAWGSLETGPGREIFAICSVAPPGSGLLDDREFATAAAKQLGVRLECVTPPEDWSVYRPSLATLESTELPTVGPRHYIYEAMQQAADRQGARAVIDGAFGEMTVTDKTHLPHKITEPLDILRTARTWMLDRWERPSWPDDAFHVQFSREFLAGLPREWKHDWRRPARYRGDAVRDGVIGVHPSARKNAQIDTATSSTQRHLMPFRDERLIRAVAPMPASFLLQGGQTRALARELLRNRVPDAVRLRHWGTPFSPDYELRLARQAANAKTRVAMYRDAGLGAWLNLDWLELELQTISAGSQLRTNRQFAAQITALTAEFLLWALDQTNGDAG